MKISYTIEMSYHVQVIQFAKILFEFRISQISKLDLKSCYIYTPITLITIVHCFEACYLGCWIEVVVELKMELPSPYQWCFLQQ